MRPLFAGFLALILLGGPARPARAEGPSHRERLGWAAQAQESFRGNDFVKASELFEKALAPGAAKGDSIRWLPLLGRCYESDNKFQKAIGVYQKAYQLQPKNADFRLDLARVFARVDLNDQAIDLYEQALEHVKNRPDVVLALARLYNKSGKIDAAEKRAEQYVRSQPQDLDAQELLAQIQEKTGNLSSAASRRENVLSQRPSGAGYVELARLWARQNQFELAEIAFKKAEDLGASDSSFFTERGLLCWRRGDSTTAVVFLGKALQADPASPVARFFLALNDFQNGKRESAIKRMHEVEAESAGDYVKDLARIFLAAQEKPGKSEK